MDTIFMSFIGILCLMLSVKVYWAEEQTKVFNKRNLPLTDVKKYNHLCAALILGFGMAAEVTIYFMTVNGGIFSYLVTLAIIVEAVAVMLLYRVIENSLIQKR